MRIAFSPAEEAFRKEVHSYLKAEVPDWYRGVFVYPGDECERAWEFSMQFAKKLAAKGWLTRSWPRAYGGQDASPVEQLIFAEEMEYFFEPRGAYELAAGFISWIIINYGTEGQKARFLPPIARAEVIWSQGFTEPDAGSDLASLKTRATLQGDNFIVNGQKIYTSYAEHADWYLLAVRTDPDAPKHRGISLLLVDMKSPGVRIRPIPAVFGMHFNEVFLDNVVVPRENLLGEMNEGWRIMMSALEHERSYDPSYMRALRRLEELVRIAAEKPWNGRRLIDKPDVRLALADMAVAIQASRLLCYRVWWMRQEGIPLTYEASALHVFNVERARHFEAAIAVLGKDLQVDPGDPSAPLFGDIASAWRWGRCRVGAGTPEVNKQVIARRGLGLPR